MVEQALDPPRTALVATPSADDMSAVPKPSPNRPWRAYIVRCADDSLYGGVSNDVARRVAAHQSGRGARYTRSRRPIILVWRSSPLDKRTAHSLEAHIKRLNRIDKLAIANGNGLTIIRRLLRTARQRALASSSAQRA